MLNLIYSINNKKISTMYLLLGLWSGMMGTSMSMLIRIELMSLNKYLNNYYFMIISIHAMLMIFFMTMPIIIGSISNWMIPLMNMNKDFLFPRLNNFSLLMLIPSLKMMTMNLIIKNNINSGWTLYPPLINLINKISLNLIIFSLHLNGMSSIMSSMNFMISMLIKNKLNMNFNNNLFLWSIMITSKLLILTIPILASAITMLILDSNLMMNFFNPLGNGNPILYQHLFWFFGHPEVYILILPSFGIMSLIMNQESGKQESFSKLNMIYAMLMISILGFLVWVHHMFTIGIDIDTQIYFMTSTMIIAIPTSIKIFSWITSLSMNNLIKSIILWCSMNFIMMFSLGGFTGIILSNSLIDLNLHDSYYVIAHFHYILSMGIIYSMLSLLIFFMPMTLNMNFNFNWMMISTIMSSISINLTFFPQHFLGLNGMPRRYPKFFNMNMIWNLISSMGSILSLLMMIIIMFKLFSMKLLKKKILFKFINNNKEWMYNSPFLNHSINENYKNIKFKHLMI